MSAWLKAISKLVQESCDVIPKEWKTSMQISKEMGVDISTAQRRLRMMKEKGLVDTRSFRVKSVDGRAVPVSHYKLKQ